MKAVRPNVVTYHHMSSVGSHSTSGRDREGKRGRTVIPA